MPYHIVRRHKTGSLGDDFNDGRLGQFRSIENARGAYMDQINKERRAQLRWKQEQELRIQAIEGLSHPPGSPRSLNAPQPIVMRDIFGNTTQVLPKINPSGGMTASTSSSARGTVGSTPAAVDRDPTMRLVAASPARACQFIAMPRQGYLPSNIPITTSEIAAAGGNGTAMRNGGWNFNYHRPSSATGISTGGSSTAMNNNSGYRRPDSACSSSTCNSRYSKHQQQDVTLFNGAVYRPGDSDDEEAISIASTTLSRREEREALKERLAELEKQVATSAKQREKLDSQIDELKDLLIAFKKEQSESRRAVGTFGNLEAPVQLTYRAQRAPGIKSGLSGFASSRKQDKSLVQ
jgi:hypothetical protein